MADLTNLENVLKEVEQKLSENTSEIKASSDKAAALNDGIVKIAQYLDGISKNAKSVATGKGAASNGGKASGDASISFAKFTSSVNKFGGFVTSFGEKIKDFSKTIETLSEKLNNVANNTAVSSNAAMGSVQAAEMSKLTKAIERLTEKEDKLKSLKYEDENSDNWKNFINEQTQIAKKQEKLAIEEEKARKQARREEENKLTKADWREQRREKRQEERERKKREGSFDFTKDTFVGRFTSSVVTSAMSLAKGSEAPSMSKVIDSAISKVPGIVGLILSVIKGAFDIYTKRERDAQTYVRAHGGGSYGLRNYMGRSLGFVEEGISARNAFGFRKAIQYTDEDFNKAMELATSGTGRSGWRQTNSNLRSGADLARFGVSPEVIKSYDTFGKSLENTDKFIAGVYGRSGRLGLSFKALSSAVNSNLKMAQTHTFAGGLKGLQRMAEKSVELKYNMATISAAADKMGNIEGAIKTGAQLSVLGGSFAAYANPMQLLNESLTDMEALNNRIISMFGDKAYFNQEKGEMDMSVFNKQRLKAAAESMGLDYGEMLNLAFNKERGNMVEAQTKARFDSDTMRYLKNVAQIDENGRAYISDKNGGIKYVSNLGESDAKMLMQESKAKDVKDGEKLGGIWAETMTTADVLDNILIYLQQRLGVWVMKGVQAVVKVVKGLSEILKKISTWFSRWENDGRKAAKRSGMLAAYNKAYLNRKDGYTKEALGQDLEEGNLENILKNVNFNEWQKENFLKSYKEGLEKRKNNKSENFDDLSDIMSDFPGAEFTATSRERNSTATSVRSSYERNFDESNTTVSNSSSANYMAYNNGASSSYSTPATQNIGPQRIEIEPVKVEINGSIDLNLPNNCLKINLNDLPNAQLLELTQKIGIQVQRRITEYFESGRNLDKHMFENGGHGGGTR